MDDDYVTHMLQKYRLAVALAVLRNKPHNISVENYIAELQCKIRESELDETSSNTTVYEEDFNLSDGVKVSVDLNEENSNNSITILQNYDFVGFENEGHNSLADVLQIIDNENRENLENSTAKETSTPNLSQINVLEHNIDNQTANEINSNINTDTGIEYSNFNNDNIKATVQCNLQKDMSFMATRNMLDTDKTQSTEAVIKDSNIFDSQETEIYTLHFPESNTHISQSQDNLIITKNCLINKQRQDINQNLNNKINFSINTDANQIIDDVEAKSKVINIMNEEIRHDIEENHGSQSIQGHLRKKVKPIQYTDTLNTEQVNTNENAATNIFSNTENLKIDIHQRFNGIFSQDSQLFSLSSQESTIHREKIQNESENLSLGNSKEKKSLENNASLDFGFLNTSHNSSASKIHNSNQSRKRIYPDLSQNSSQSELSNLNSKSNSRTMHSNQNYPDSLFGMNSMDSLHEDSHINVDNTYEFNQLHSNYDVISTELHLDDKMVNISNLEDSRKINDIVIDSETKINEVNSIQNCNKLSNPRDTTPIQTNSHLEKQIFSENNNSLNNAIYNKHKISDTDPFNYKDRHYQHTGIQNEINIVKENEQINERPTVNERTTCFELDSDTDVMKDLSESQAEIIPFKVMEELNKIKNYLNKRNRFNSESHGTDSGYKSNSRESYHNASQSSLWLNQSAHCLFTYLSQCPLLVSTMEINYEIAKALGVLIDRLHDDEKYPTFLDEMLEFIDRLLLNVYNGDFSDVLFLKNDESIDRLILLNKSQNIIKFTIEKITKVLENFHERLERGSHVELENINNAENLCFVFHLLEILLKKHTTQLSQTSQQSQDEKILKRSTLTEIWRKKWNLTKAEVYHKHERRDVIVMCSDVLNKIIVRSMEGYSLVAFAALQCFNLLQS